MKQKTLKEKIQTEKNIFGHFTTNDSVEKTTVKNVANFCIAKHTYFTLMANCKRRV